MVKVRFRHAVFETKLDVPYDVQELQRRINKLQRIGPKKFSFRFDTDDNLTKRLPKSFWRDSGLVIAALVLLTGFFILSYFVILCDTWTRH